MDGPDLSHLLDGDGSERPSPDVLDGIVRRHRRLRARRARAAATLGLVLALAGAGVGIGLSHGGARTSTSSALGPSTTHGGGAPTANSAPAGRTGTPAKTDGGAPAGLGWVDTGTAMYFGAESTAAPTQGAASPPVAARLQVTGTSPNTPTASSGTCSLLTCPTDVPTNLALGAARIRHLFTRTSDGVTVRAFSALWTASPIELVPVSTSGGSSGGELPAGGGSNGSGTAPETPSTTSAPSPGCALTRALVVEVSDAGAVGVVTVPLGASLARPLDVLADQVVGIAEQSPIAVVVAHATGSTAAVRATFVGGGQDMMAVVDGWAVLVDRLASANSNSAAGAGAATLGQATVYALSSSGDVLERAVLPGSGSLALPVAVCEAGDGNHKAPGSTGSGSGSSGPATSSSVNSVSAVSGPASAGSGSGSAGNSAIPPSTKPNGG